MHDDVAAMWETRGDGDLALLERRSAELERAAAELDRDKARLFERRGVVDEQGI